MRFDEWLTVAPDWLSGGPDWMQRLCYSFYQTWIMDGNWKFFADGLRITLLTTVGALILGVLIGVFIAIVRSSYDSRRAGTRPNPLFWLLNQICKLYLTVIRGTPMMVQLLISCFVIMLPRGEQELLMCAIITFGINSGAYVAEIVRSGIMSISSGQMEAGRSLGLNYGQTMRYIIIPQAIKNILPALGNELIVLVKETSIVTTIGLKDLTKGAQIIVTNTYNTMMTYISLAVIYLVIVLILTKLLGIFERRLRASDRR